MSSSYARLADIPLTVDGYVLEPLAREVSSAFERRTTVVRLRGAGAEGLGEDVVYDADDHDLWRDDLPLRGRHTLASFAALVSGLDLFSGRAPQTPAYRLYRRWSLEAAALDLALRQAGTSLHEALGREPSPVRVVSSRGLSVIEDLDAHPAGTRFKLNASVDWTDELVAALRERGVVDVVDLKGHYRDTVVDLPADPELYRRVAEGLPDAWIEDAWLDERTRPVLEPHRDRLTWDEPIHGLADVRALPFPPRMINVKPSRVGSLEALLELYGALAAAGIGAYGGGQFELGPGRPQIQYLAAIFHPDAPNDVAPHDPAKARGPLRAPVAFGGS